MELRSRPSLSLAILGRGALLLFGATLWGATFNVQGPNLTVNSPNATVSFQGPDVTSIVNQLTGESYLRATAPVTLSGLLTSGVSNALTAGSWIVNNGGTSATLKATDGIRSISITVSVDPATQEIVANLSGQSTQAGLQRLTWGMTGFDMTAGKFILPALGGVELGSAALTKQASYYFGVEDSYRHWDAPLALYQTGQGGVAVYSSDTQALYKNFVLAGNRQSTANAFFSVAAAAPWPQAQSAGPVEWRIAAYKGGWQQGARIYLDWHNAAMPPVPLTGARAWAAQIHTVVKISYLSSYDATVLDQLAKEVVPSQTLLYVADWRLSPFDTNYPDYTPAANAAQFAQHAHALGFHIMLHASMTGVSPSNSEFNVFSQFQALDETGQLQLGFDWLMSASTPNRYAYVDPASGIYRALLLNRLKGAIQSLGADAVHLNASGWPANDGRGAIGGMTFAQGEAQLHQDLLDAFPGLILGGEGINNVISPFETFQQQGPWPAGFDPATTPPVPITAYVFPNVLAYGHLGYPNPYEAGFLDYFTQYEGQAVLPTYSLGFAYPDQPNYTNPDMLRQLGVIQAFQQYQLTPDWDADWGSANLQYRGSGATARLTDDGTSVQLQLQKAQGSSILYRRVHGTDHIETGLNVPSWPVYNSGLIMGLDPAAQYWLDSTPQDAKLVHVSSLSAGLPSGIKLSTDTDSLVTPNFAYFKFLPTASTPYDFFANLWLANMGVSSNGSDLSMGNGAEELPQTVTVGGESRAAIFAQPPYLGGVAGGATFIEYSVPISDGYSASVSFAVGVSDSGGVRTAPMTFQVFVNGALAWQNNVGPGQWLPGSVNLTLFLNQTVRIRFQTGPGPSGDPAYAWGGWSALQLSVVEKPANIDLTIAAPSALTSSSITLPGGTATVNNGVVSIQGLPLNQTLLLFVSPPVAAVAGQSLLSLPFTLSQSAPGELAGPSQIAYAGTIGATASGGVTKQNTIYAYSPSNGQLILSWPLRLPAAPLSLSFSAGLRDGAVPSIQGVLLSVRVNGTVLWQYNANNPAHWQYGTVDLSAWAGQNVLIELISDSQGPNFQDWTSWAELLLSGSQVGSCAATLDLTQNINAPASGMAGSVQVTTADGCLWSAAPAIDWIAVSPVAGNGSGSVNYTVQSNPGPQREGTISIAGNLLQVTQQSSLPPDVNAGGVVNAASYRTQIAPGSLTTIFGANLAQAEYFAGGAPLPLSMGGLTVTVNGILAPILYAGPNQINFQTPYEIQSGTATVNVSVRDEMSVSQQVIAAAAAPGIFSYGDNHAIAQNQDYSLNGAGNGALPGDYVTVYITGGGAVDNPVATGQAASITPLSRFTQAVTATIGGLNATVIFAGLTPGFAGLGQISVRIPNLPAGAYPLVLTENGQSSNSAIVTVSAASSTAHVRQMTR